MPRAGLLEQQILQKPTYRWKRNNTFLNDNFLREETTKEIIYFLEFRDKEGTAYPKFWDTMKAVLRGKLIAMSTSKNKLEGEYTRSLTHT